jgi:uncharacterized protein involved in type VI secretion and phage assembly
MEEQALADVMDRLRNRFFGKYRGTVTDVDAGTLRIKAKVPAVLADQKTGWCMACVPFAGDGVGMAFLPDEGAGVWIEFEGGDVSYPIWTGCYWRTGEPPSDATPSAKVMVTKSKLKLLLKDDVPSITITDGSNNTITMDATGITLSRGGTKIEIGDAEVNVNDGALEVLA